MLSETAKRPTKRGILVASMLKPASGLRTSDEVVYQAVYTIFRGLPARLVDGATLRVSTHARAGGDVELVWEAAETAPPASRASGSTPAEVLAEGPFGDLFEVALVALEDVCRARGGLSERVEEAPASSAILREPVVHRRYMFLIPSLDRAPYSPPSGRASPEA